jgi:transposase-like protein
METTTPFKWRHFQAEIILLCVRWYLRYPLSYRDLEEMMIERGLYVDHMTIYRWVQCYAPELERRCRVHLKATNDSWRVDETYIKVKKAWMYLCWLLGTSVRKDREQTNLCSMERQRNAPASREKDRIFSSTWTETRERQTATGILR